MKPRKPTANCPLCKGTGLVEGEYCSPCYIRAGLEPVDPRELPSGWSTPYPTVVDLREKFRTPSQEDCPQCRSDGPRVAGDRRCPDCLFKSVDVLLRHIDALENLAEHGARRPTEATPVYLQVLAVVEAERQYWEQRCEGGGLPLSPNDASDGWAACENIAEAVRKLGRTGPEDADAFFGANWDDERVNARRRTEAQETSERRPAHGPQVPAPVLQSVSGNAEGLQSPVEAGPVPLADRNSGESAADRRNASRQTCAHCGAKLPLDVACLLDASTGDRYCAGSGCYRKGARRRNEAQDGPDLYVAAPNQCESVSPDSEHSCTVARGHEGNIHVEIDPMFGLPRFAWVERRRLEAQRYQCMTCSIVVEAHHRYGLCFGREGTAAEHTWQLFVEERRGPEAQEQDPNSPLYIACHGLAVYGHLFGWRCSLCQVSVEGDAANGGYAPKPFPHHESCVLALRRAAAKSGGT